MAVGVKVDDANFQLILKRMQEQDLAALDDSQRKNLATLMDVADSQAAAPVSTPPKAQKKAAQKPPTKKGAPLPSPPLPEDLISVTAPDSISPVTTSQQKKKPRAAAGTVKVTVVQDHTTESGLVNTASAIVTSVTHLENETKTGLAAVADTIKNVFGSLKGALGGGGPTGVGGPPPPSGRGSVFIWPNGPWTQPQEQDRQTRQGIYTAEADKHIQYRDSWVTRKKQEWLTVGGLANKMFDKNGLIGGMVHRKLEQNRDEKSYAEMQAIHQSIHGGEKKTPKQYRKQAREVNALRKDASKFAAQLDRYEAEGWDEETIRETAAYRGLRWKNAEIFEKDPAAAKQFEKWNREKDQKDSSSSHASGRGSERSQWEAHANATGEGDPAQAAKPKSTIQPSKESEEEAREDREDLLAVIEKIVANTEPIKDIADFLGVKTDDKKDDKRKGGSDPKEKGFFGKAKDLIGGVVSDYRAGGARKVLERVSGLGGGMVGRVTSTVATAGGRVAGAVATGATMASPYARTAGVAAVRGAGTLAMGAGRLAAGALSLAVANPLAAGVAVAGIGAAYGAYKAYQWWKGSDSTAPSQVDTGLGPKGKRGRKVVPERFENREDYVNAFEKKHNWNPNDIDSRNDARTEAEMTWTAKKGYTPYEKEMKQRAIEMMKPKPISTSSSAPVVNTLNQVDNSSKSYITMESKAVDTDASLGRQREARWP